MLLIHRNDRKPCSLIVRKLHDFYQKCTSEEKGESYCLQRRALTDGYSPDNDGNLAASLILGLSQLPPSIESTKSHENLSFSKVTIEDDQTMTRIENRATKQHVNDASSSLTESLSPINTKKVSEPTAPSIYIASNYQHTEHISSLPNTLETQNLRAITGTSVNVTESSTNQNTLKNNNGHSGDQPSPSEIALTGYPNANADGQTRSNPQRDLSVDTVHIPSSAQRFSLRKVTELVGFVRNWLSSCFGAWGTQDEVQS
jgi:hypothetical protein